MAQGPEFLEPRLKRGHAAKRHHRSIIAPVGAPIRRSASIMPTAGPRSRTVWVVRGRTGFMSAQLSKSSGSTSSRNFLNSSRRSALSDSAIWPGTPASSITASATQIGAPTRDARATASDGRESTTRTPDCRRQRDLGEEGAVVDAGDLDPRDLRAERLEQRAHEVVRERTRHRRLLDRDQDRGRLELADPDRQQRPFARKLVDRLQQEDVLARRVERDACHTDLDHRPLPPDRACPCHRRHPSSPDGRGVA